MESLQSYQDATIRRYEKRIRKTNRVANQTEQKLKKQQTSLLHFKKELSRHVVKLQELSSSGDPHAHKRLRNVKMKLAQLDKIVPYLGKYISVNRQAEIQTIAVLKESCTVELQKLSQSKFGILSKSVTDSVDSADLPDLDKPFGLESSSNPTSHDEVSRTLKDSLYAQQPPLAENPYASLLEVRKGADNKVKLRSNYAELDFQRIHGGESVRPPSVKYSEVIIDATGIGRVVPNQIIDRDGVSHNKLPPLSTQEQTSDCQKETDKTDCSLQDTTLTPENSSLFAEDFPVMNVLHDEGKIASIQTTDENLLNHSSSLTLEERCHEEIRQSSITCKNQKTSAAPLSRVDSIDVEKDIAKCPPPVSRKPISRPSIIHTQNAENQDTDSSFFEVEDNETNLNATINHKEQVSPPDITPRLEMLSVIDRIKVIFLYFDFFLLYIV